MGKSNSQGSFEFTRKKKRRLLYAPILKLAVGDDVDDDVDVDGWEPKLLITDPCDSVTVSDIKPGKRGLIVGSSPYCGGGGSVLTHYLITWLETDGQLGTRDGSSGRPGALLEISFPILNSSTPYLNIYIVFVTGEDEYSLYNYRRYIYAVITKNWRKTKIPLMSCHVAIAIMWNIQFKEKNVR